jgi:hypothetical protein
MRHGQSFAPVQKPHAELLEVLGLAHCADRTPTHMSGGTSGRPS